MDIEYKKWENAYSSDIYKFKLKSSDGSYVELTNLGATWVSAVFPDKYGNMSDVLLGYDTADEYLKGDSYFGATIGRYANRISNSQFVIDNEIYKLEPNDGRNSNHGGFSGWHKRVWDWSLEENTVVFKLISPHNEGGYPGNVSVAVKYTFDDSHKLTIRHIASSDRKTYVNMTNHAYFNLSGNGNKVVNHILRIPAKTILQTTRDFIPTGQLLPICHTPFDFNIGHRIGDYMQNPCEQLIWNKGYNHCYCLGKAGLLKQAASLSDIDTGRMIDVWTSYPSVLLYTGGYLPFHQKGKKGMMMDPDCGVCLETQFFPDAPNQKNFPSTLLLPSSIYDHVTMYQFKTI